MHFSEIIGQDNIIARLIDDVNKETIPHAQLFYGKEGTGNLQLALAYAQYLNCENKNDQDSCGSCLSCIKSNKFIHPDIHFSFPVFNKGGSRPPTSDEFLSDWRDFLTNNTYGNLEDWLLSAKSENKPANITKEECRNIVKKLSLKTYEGKYKIMLIWLPEYLGNNSNSLLKILEEPTDNTIFLLIAENKNLLLSTVLSRVQIVNVPPIDVKLLAEHIAKSEHINLERALYISNISNGSLRKAKIFCQEENNPNEAYLKNWLNMCFKGHPLKMISWSEKIAKESRINQLGFLQYVSNILRQALLSRYGEFSFYSETEEKLSKTLIQLINFDGIDKLNEKIGQSILHVNRNANPKILFLNLSFHLNKMLKKS